MKQYTSKKRLYQGTVFVKILFLILHIQSTYDFVYRFIPLLHNFFVLVGINLTNSLLPYKAREFFF